MNNLSCSVTRCVTNKDGCCCRPSIQVEGPSASARNETICHSFQEKNGASNSTDHYSTPNNSLDIGCSVCKCSYNKNDKCHSDSVTIDCSGANSECATFTTK